MAHCITFRVYYEDTDAGGIVYHARYLGFAERARSEALRALGLPIGQLAKEENLGFVVANLSIHYKSPAQLDALLEVRTELIKAGAVRLVLKQTISTIEDLGDGPSTKRLNAVLTVELATINLSPFKMRPLPAPYKEALMTLMADG